LPLDTIRKLPIGLRIGCVPDVPMQRLQAFIGAFYTRDPRVRIDVTFLDHGEQLRRLRAGELHIGVTHDSRDDAGIETEPLFAGEPLVAFLAIGHPLAERPALDPEHLSDQELLIFPRSTNAPLHDWLIGETGFHFAAVRETTGSDPRDVLFAVAGDHAVTLGPLSMLHGAGGVDRLIVRRPVDPPRTMPDTVIAWCAEPPPHLRTAIEHAGEVARELRAWQRQDI
jgi:DNA-binding transcriptional LysR family regulator